MLAVQAIGHLGNDCIVRETNGKTVISFSIAHSEKYTDSNGQKMERTTWVNCSYWPEKSTIAQYLKKGQLVHVSGMPSVSAYENKQKQPAADFRLTVQRLELLGGKKEEGTNSGQPAPQTNTSHSQTSNDDVPDDLPF